MSGLTGADFFFPFFTLAGFTGAATGAAEAADDPNWRQRFKTFYDCNLRKLKMSYSAMFVERKVGYSALFTNLVRWHAGAVSFPLCDVILALLA